MLVEISGRSVLRKGNGIVLKITSMLCQFLHRDTIVEMNVHYVVKKLPVKNDIKNSTYSTLNNPNLKSSKNKVNHPNHNNDAMLAIAYRG